MFFPQGKKNFHVFFFYIKESGIKNLKYQFSKVSEQSVTENPDFGFIRSITINNHNNIIIKSSNSVNSNNFDPKIYPI